MLMAAVVPRDTVVTYKPPRGTKVKLSTANHVALADTGSVWQVKGDLGLEEERSLSLPSRGRNKALLGQNGSAVTSVVASCTASLTSLHPASTKGPPTPVVHPPFVRSDPPRDTHKPGCSCCVADNLDHSLSPSRQQRQFIRTPSLGSDTKDPRPNSCTATEETTVPLVIQEETDREEEEEEEEEEVVVVEKLLKNPRVVMLKSNSLNFTPVVVSQQSKRSKQQQQQQQQQQQCCLPHPLSPTTSNLPQRRSVLMAGPTRRANYRTHKTVSFDCEPRTETFQTEVTEPEMEHREMMHLMGTYERRPHVRLPLTHDDEYCPPGKEEQDVLPKMLCFALALVITGGILYGLNLIISRMNMNLFSG